MATNDLSIQKIQLESFSRSIPTWATENTLKNLDKNVADIVYGLKIKRKIQTQEEKKLTEQVKSFRQSLEEAEESVVSAGATQQFTVKKFAESFDKTRSAIDQLSYSFRTGNSRFSNLSTIMFNFGEVSKTLKEPMGRYGGALAALSALFNKITSTLASTIEMNIKLYDSGITFQNSLLDLRMAASNSVMTLDAFSELVAKNSSLVKAFGSNGVTSMSNVLSATHVLTRNGATMGMTFEKLNETVVDYLETTRVMGAFEQMNNQQRAQASVRFVDNLTRISQVMGRSRAEIHREFQNFARDAKIIAATRAAGPDAEKFMQTFENTLLPVIGIVGEQSKEFVQDVFASITTIEGFVNSELLKGLAAANAMDIASDFSRFATEFREGLLTPAQATAQISDIMTSIGNLERDQLESLRNHVQVSTSALSKGAEIISMVSANISSLGNLNIADAIKERKDLDKSAQNLVAFRNAYSSFIARISTIFTTMLSDGGFLNFAERALKYAAAVMERIVSFFDGVDSEAGFVERITSAASKMWDHVSVIIAQGFRDAMELAIAMIKDSLIPFSSNNVKKLEEERARQQQIQKILIDQPPLSDIELSKSDKQLLSKLVSDIARRENSLDLKGLLTTNPIISAYRAYQNNQDKKALQELSEKIGINYETMILHAKKLHANTPAQTQPEQFNIDMHPISRMLRAKQETLQIQPENTSATLAQMLRTKQETLQIQPENTSATLTAPVFFKSSDENKKRNQIIESQMQNQSKFLVNSEFDNKSNLLSSEIHTMTELMQVNINLTSELLKTSSQQNNYLQNISSSQRNMMPWVR